MIIKVPYYRFGETSVWAGYQVVVENENSRPKKRGYIIQFYSENKQVMDQTRIFGSKYAFNNMINQKLNKGFTYAGECLVDTKTGVFKEAV